MVRVVGDDVGRIDGLGWVRKTRRRSTGDSAVIVVYVDVDINIDIDGDGDNDSDGFGGSKGGGGGNSSSRVTLGKRICRRHACCC